MKSNLSEKSCHELVTVDLMDLFALQSTATLWSGFGLDETTIR